MKLTHSIQFLQSQAQTDSVFQKSNKGPDVRALQMLLYDLGFGTELKWEQYRADGGYGGSTTAAVQAFLNKNGDSGDGTSVDANLLKRMLDRQAILPDLRQLKQHLDSNTLAQLNPAIIQHLLGALGIQVRGDELDTALKGLAAKLGATFSGGGLNHLMAKALLGHLSKGLGDGWATVDSGNGSARRSAAYQVVQRNKGVKVLDDWLSVNFSKAKRGYWTMGEALPDRFIRQHREALLEQGMTASAVNVLLPVSANEGNLDAINTWDDSFMTFGMFQWTLGQKGNRGELAGLLKRIKDEKPNVFAEFFGQYGLDIADARKTTGYLSLNGQKISSASQKEAFRDTSWAFRFWRAGLNPWVQLIEVKHAADRINSFRNHPDYKPLDTYAIEEIITSEYGMCLILDHSVNRPGHLMRYAIGKKDIIGQAMKNAGLGAKAPKTWGTSDEAKLIEAYLPLRAASSMTHGAERAEKIKKMADQGLLSKERNSFQMPKQGESGTRSLEVVAAPEVAYPRVDPAEYEQRVSVE